MEIDSLAGKAVGWLLTSGRSMWRRFRYGSRLSLALSWERPLIWALGERTQRWRAIELHITASKDEEFVLAKGHLEARKVGSWKWKSVENLENLLHLPIQVEKNRQSKKTIAGSSIATRLEGIFAQDEQVEIRIIAEDYHRSRAKSDVLVVTRAELLQEEIR